MSLADAMIKRINEMTTSQDKWDTYYRNNIEPAARKMFMTTHNPYRDIEKELKEKENMFDKFNYLEASYQGRPLVIDSWEVTDSCSPYETPTFGIKAHLSRGSVSYNEYAKVKKAETKMPTIKKVHFNPPVTVVLWDDNTKTIVRCENEEFDAEKGLAMAITKKVLGNKGNYFETVKKWVKPYEKEHPKPEKIKINAGLKPATFKFTLADVDINELSKLVGATTKDGTKIYFGNHEKLTGEV